MVASLGWSVPGVNLNLSLGPLFLAHCFNWCLYGLLVLQVFMFYASFPKEPTRVKVLVYTLLIVDSASIAMSTYSGYWVFVANWGNVAVFHELGWSWATVPASSGLVALIVQSFFAHRIYLISRKWYMPAFIVLLSTLACTFAFLAANEVAHLQTFTYIRHLRPSIWLSFGIAADFFVCATLCYYLLSAPTGFALTNRVIIRLVRISIETAAITIVAAAIKLYLIFSRHDNMHLLICLLLARLYSNALLGTLNSRNAIFGGDQTVQSKKRSSLRLWSAGEGSSFGSIKKPMKLSDGQVVVTCTSETDIESGITGEEQEIPYSAMVPTYPLSPMAPSYKTNAAPSVRTTNQSTPLSPPPPVTPPASAGFPKSLQ